MDYSQSAFPYAGLQLNTKFKSSLFPHQSQAVEWMLYREQIPHDNIRGGMLLDEMGLGKSLTALSNVVLSGGLTLIIVPAQLVYVWESEIKRHFEDILYFVYHGPMRKKRFERYRLKGQDPTIIIMSYQSVVVDIEDEGGPLWNMDFHRIVFDECHYIKNQNTEIFKSVTRIRSNVKWFLSGTPIMNKIHEMYPYLKLLRYKHIKSIPQSARFGGRNGYYGDQKDDAVDSTKYAAMQNLLRTIAIRRTKSILNLPTKSYSNVYIDLSPEEREFYQALTAYSRHRVKKLMRNMKRVRGSQLLPPVQNRLRVIILQCMLSLIFHLRIACCDPLLVIDKIPRTRDLDVKAAIRELKKESVDEPLDGRFQDCPVCYNDEATVTNVRCGHVACRNCWKRLSKMNPMMCFSCLDETDTIHLVDRTPQKKDILKQSHDERVFYRSSKTSAVMNLICRELSAGNKVVVISQWTTYLDVVISQFRKENKDVKYIRLDGKTIPVKRQKTVDEFQEQQDIKVCFASLGSSAEGITLHSACTMIICDVYWNQAKISQVSDRIHRIGQKNDVVVHCLFVKDSIEIRLKELVDRKDMVCKVVVDCAPISRYVESWLTRMIKLVD